MTASKKTDRLSRWLVQLKARSGWQKAVVALANKCSDFVDHDGSRHHVRPRPPAADSGGAPTPTSNCVSRLGAIRNTCPHHLRRANGDAHHRSGRQQVNSALIPSCPARSIGPRGRSEERLRAAGELVARASQISPPSCSEADRILDGPARCIWPRRESNIRLRSAWKLAVPDQGDQGKSNFVGNTVTISG
jgi:hypothetical protein